MRAEALRARTAHFLAPSSSANGLQRAVAGLTDTFASHYKAEITLEEMLQHDVAMAYNAKATGEKYLVVPGG